MTVFKKLQEARIKLQNTDLKKSGLNKFAGYRYFELGDFLPTIQNICNELGLCGHVTFYTDIAILSITDVEDPAQFIEFKCPMSSAALKGCHEVQNLGAVQTYLRRYLWTNAFEIVEHDSIDSAKPIEAEAEVITESKINDAKDLLTEANAKGELKKAFFALGPELQEKVREFANELKKSA
jgi:hypothetical protein